MPPPPSQKFVTCSDLNTFFYGFPNLLTLIPGKLDPNECRFCLVLKDLNNLPYLVHFNSVLNCLVVFKLWLGTAFFRLCFLEQISHTLLFLICLGFLDRRRIGWGKGEHSHAHHGGGGGEAVG